VTAPQPIRIPRLGMTATEATLVEWSVADGAAVQPGDVIAVIETDKVETELEAPSAGTLVASAVPGTVLEIGAVIGEVVP
jgi:pyruvate/2-oxoglutarate dehydrogenase complex dihydrolipoamide acyltransferase (E2) component